VLRGVDCVRLWAGGGGDEVAEEGSTLRELEGIRVDDPTAAPSGDDERLYAHAGMMASARAIVADLAALGLLERISREQPEWELTVVGHSLGGAVAALVAWLLRAARHPQVVSCWAIDPPGMTCSPALARRMEPFCTSVTYGSSWVSRFTGFVALRKCVASALSFTLSLAIIPFPCCVVLLRGTRVCVCFCFQQEARFVSQPD